MDEQMGGTAELEVLRQTLAYVRDIASYLRREDLAEVLIDEGQRQAYRLSDGRRSAATVRDEAGLSVADRTIRKWWEKWVEAGIAERSAEGQARAKYDVTVLPALTPVTGE